MDQSDPFESALSSMVSSPTTTTTPAGTAIHGGGGAGDGVVLRELIGRLGSICNSGDISPQSYIGYSNNKNNSTDNSCYSTPLNSPPKLNLSMMDQQQIRGNLPIPGGGNQFAPFATDPGFAERAARFSCFGGRNFGQLGQNETEFPTRSTPLMDSGKLSRVSSNQSLKLPGSRTNEDGNGNGNSVSDKKFNRLSRSSTPEMLELGEESSVSEQVSGGEIGLKTPNDGNGRKRKSIPKGKSRDIIPPSPSVSAAKDAAKAVPDNDESNAKRSKSDESNGGGAAGERNQKQNKENSKLTEAPKDYIHVRARRGQATDSHSLAERVRREKISERMKFLQDLVPGCNKVTGKAVMLDEIINYVQSLQRQVEFLSMKLSTVNPRMDFNAETLLSKDVFQSRGNVPQTMYPIDSSASAFPYSGYQSQGGSSVQSAIVNGTDTQFSMSPLNAAAAFRRNSGMQQLPQFDGFGEASSQVMAFWEDDLHSVVQMGFGQNSSECFNGTLTASQMKIEL